jgi:two-component system sensor histidine kinase UhpB
MKDLNAQGASWRGTMNTMDKKMLDVLVVEDDIVDYKAVERALARYRDPVFALHHAETLEKGQHMLEDRDYDAVILDLGLPDVHGMDSLVHFHANAPATPILVLTGQGDVRTANQAMDFGAEDFLLKSELYPERLEEKLRLSLGRHQEKLRMLQDKEALARTVTHIERRRRQRPEGPASPLSTPRKETP